MPIDRRIVSIDRVSTGHFVDRARPMAAVLAEETWFGLQFLIARVPDYPTEAHEAHNHPIMRLDLDGGGSAENNLMIDHVRFVFANCKDPALVTDAQVAKLVGRFALIDYENFQVWPDLCDIFNMPDDWDTCQYIRSCSTMAFELAKRLLGRAPQMSKKVLENLFSSGWAEDAGLEAQIEACTNDPDEWEPFFECPECECELLDSIYDYFFDE